MNKHNLNAMVLLLAAAVPLTATASVEEGVYIGGGLGVSHMSPSTGGTIYSTDKEYDVGGKLYLGYDLNMDLSIEGYYSDLGSVDMSPYGSIGYKDMGLDATYYVYSSGEARQGLSVFIRGGIGRMQNDTSLPYTKEHNAHFMYGAGLEYGLGNGWAARADIDLYDRDAQMVTVGVLKRFGSTPEPVAVTPPPPPPPEPAVVPEPPAPEPVVNPDSDGDGVPDASDNCPNTPSGTKVDASGCELKARLVLQGVTFANNSSELVGDSDAILDKVAASLIRYPDLYIEVGGYTDSVGASKANQKLSERRANTVRDYLISKGIAADHITAKGYGEESPVADNKTAEGRAQNRRVELKMLDAK